MQCLHKRDCFDILWVLRCVVEAEARAPIVHHQGDVLERHLLDKR